MREAGNLRDGLSRRRLLVATSAVLGSSPLLRPRHAVATEAPQLRLAVQFGIVYLPLLVMQEQRLIETAAEAAHLPVPQVTWRQFSGGAAMNDALISGSLDFGAAGVPPILVAWDRTRANLGIRAVAPLASLPSELLTNRAGVATVADFNASDRIAVPSVKVSFQAIVLQMAAAKAFGADQFARLDPLTVNLDHPDATAALLSGHGGITAHFSNPPFQEQELSHPSVHRVFSSYDVLGGPHSAAMLYATGRFHAANPRWVAVVIDALQRAQAFIAADPHRAAQVYAKAQGANLSLDFIEQLLRDPRVQYTPLPRKIMAFAEFQHRTGQLKTLPGSWHDVFFSELAAQTDIAAAD